jgi:hypothetical protein
MDFIHFLLWEVGSFITRVQCALEMKVHLDKTMLVEVSVK